MRKKMIYNRKISAKECDDPTHIDCDILGHHKQISQTKNEDNNQKKPKV